MIPDGVASSSNAEDYWKSGTHGLYLQEKSLSKIDPVRILRCLSQVVDNMKEERITKSIERGSGER